MDNDPREGIIFEFNLDVTKIDLTESIGTGGFGVVFPYRNDQDDAKKWVVKIIPNTDFEKGLRDMKEIILGFGCDHNCVLPVKGFALKKLDEQSVIYIKMPRMKYSLREIMKHKFDENQIVSLFYNLTLGLEYLHNKGIVHNDIKPENILIDRGDQIKISDLGIGEYVEAESSQKISRKCTRIYSAPELLKDDLTTKDRFKADIWSLGLVMAELHGVKPNPKNKGDLESHYTEELEKLKGNKVLLNLIANILKCRPEERYSLEKIKNELELHFSYLKKSSSNKSQHENPDEKNIIENETSINDLEKTRKELESTFGHDFNFTVETKRGIKIELNSHQKKNEKTLLNDLTKKIVELKQDIHDEKLRDFRYNFLQFSKNTHKMIEDFANNIKFYLSDLQRLSIDFSGCNQIKDETIEHLTKKIGSGIINLEHLSLNLSSCKELTSNSIEKITNVIKPSSTIKSFCFDFSWLDSVIYYYLYHKLNRVIVNNTSTMTIKNLGKSIEKHLKGLNHLSLKFVGCDEIFEDVIECIGNKPLKYFYLNLSRNRKIKDQTIKKITTQIQQNLKDLQHLSLKFCCCYEITEQSVIESIKQLSQLDKLTKLFLDFSNCEKIPQKIILEPKELQDNHKRLKQINKFTLAAEFTIENGRDSSL